MKAITYQLHLLEPVLVTAPGGDPNSDNSHGYIPGSAMRGALVKRYLQQGNEAGDERFKRLFLDGRVRFLNAYPTLVMETEDTPLIRRLPTPRCWVLKKDDETNRIYDRSKGEDEDPRIPKRIKASFVHVNGQEVYAPKTEFVLAVHTARNREMGRAVENDPASAIYRYKALAPGQRFAGVIVVDSDDDTDADVATLHDLLKKADLLLGGSQSAGYGLTHVVDCEQSDSWREGDGAIGNVAAGEEILLYLASDAILRNAQTGREGNDILGALPPGLRGLVTLSEQSPHSFTSMTWVGGFNATWGLPLPQSWAVEKGSVWRLSATTDIAAQELARLERKGVGARRAEGFGSVIVNPPWLQQAKKLVESAPQFHSNGEPSVLSGVATTVLERMNQRMLDAALQRRLVEKAQKMTSKPLRGRLSKSQIARLRLRVRNRQDGLSGLAEYLEGTKRRKSADDQFRSFYIGRKNFRDWLLDLSRQPQKVWSEILAEGNGSEPWQPVTIGEFRLDREDEALTSYYTIRLIDAVCEQLAKKDRGHD